jgi:glutamate N-acetyltransferase/amino-acid N-acetyltransferase
MSYIEISGGITAARGFLAGSAYCGIKASNPDRPDIALVYSLQPAVGVGTFTTNRVKAAPVRVSMMNVRSADVRAIIANAGNANACTGVRGIEYAKRMVAATAEALGVKDRQVLVCSTGRIGVQLPIEKMEKTIAALPGACSECGSNAAACAIMTSDTKPKEIAVEIEIEGSLVRSAASQKAPG